MNTKSSTVTKYALISAIVFMGFAIDTLLKSVFVFQIAVVSLIAVLAISILTTRKEAIVAGLALGIFSLIRAFVMPSVVQSFWVSFMNPLIAVLPRVFIGLVARESYRALSKVFKKRVISASVASALGVATNTLGVCLVMLVMKTIFTPDFALWDFIVTFFTVNCLVEIAVCAVVVPMLCVGLSKSEYFAKGDNK